MTHLEPYLGILFTLSVGVGVVALSSFFPQALLSPMVATTTIPLVWAVPMPLPVRAIPIISFTETSTTPVKMSAAEPRVVPVLAVSSTTHAAASTQARAFTAMSSSEAVTLDTVATTLRAALVNIICYAPVGSALHSISGSGVFIDSKGIILTNAHVAQYFLLADQGVSCTIRSGSPALDKYTASLVYISPEWVQTNASVVTETAPSGTGEYDFALLAVTGSKTGNSLPALFPFIPLASHTSTVGTPVVIGSYGAQFLQASQVQTALYPTLVFGSIKKVLTFTINTPDVIALGGSAAAQEGSSGGGIADAAGTLVGTITTSTMEGATATRDLDAITANYIRSEYAHETGRTLDSLLAEAPSVLVADFAPQIAPLGALITAQLN